MTERHFTLEALEAAEGDALLLHYGLRSKPRLIVIDGGPKDIFKHSLSPRLRAIRQARGGGTLEVRMLMVSHIDGDHITGVLDLTQELLDAQDAGEEPAYDILTLWHNSFDDIVAKLGAETQSLVQRLRAHKKLSSDVTAIIATVPQGRTLRLHANALSLNVNSGFDDLVSFDGTGESSLDIGEKLHFLVLGPRQAEIDALEGKWAEEVKKLLAKKKRTAKKKAAKNDGAARSAVSALGAAELLVRAEAELASSELAEAAAKALDDSIANLSSIVVLASCEGKQMLLTGDALSDFVMDSLRDCKLLPKKGGHLHIDLMKAPHHGSDRNVTEEFLRTVTADHYVFSANGKNGNPDVETFRMLFAVRPKGPYTLWLTNHVAKSVQFIKKNKPAGVHLKVREDPARSLKIELGAQVPF